MKVLVAFYFEDVKPDTTEADRIVTAINDSCEVMQVGFDAQGCWVADIVSDKEA